MTHRCQVWIATFVRTHALGGSNASWRPRCSNPVSMDVSGIQPNHFPFAINAQTPASNSLRTCPGELQRKKDQDLETCRSNVGKICLIDVCGCVCTYVCCIYVRINVPTCPCIHAKGTPVDSTDTGAPNSQNFGRNWAKSTKSTRLNNIQTKTLKQCSKPLSTCWCMMMIGVVIIILYYIIIRADTIVCPKNRRVARNTHGSTKRCYNKLPV